MCIITEIILKRTSYSHLSPLILVQMVQNLKHLWTDITLQVENPTPDLTSGHSENAGG